MSGKPLVSVLMTAYNRELFIKQAIESVLKSSFSDYELIIVDDCSTDRTYAISQSFESIDQRVKVYRNETNLGDFHNRNKAASYARGKYLKYLDSDDVIYPHGLEVMVHSMEEHPGTAMGLNFPDSNISTPYPQVVTSRQVYLQQFMGNGFFFTGPSGTIINRESFYRAGQFSGLRFVGDFQCWLNLCLNEPVVIFQPGLVWWRKHPDQEYQIGQGPERYLKLTLEVYYQFLDHPDSPLLPEERLDAQKTFIARQARKVLYFLLLKGKPAFAFKVYRYSNLKWYQIIKGFKRPEVSFDLQKELAWQV